MRNIIAFIVKNDLTSFFSASVIRRLGKSEIMFIENRSPRKINIRRFQKFIERNDITQKVAKRIKLSRRNFTVFKRMFNWANAVRNGKHRNALKIEVNENDYYAENR